MVSWFDIPLFGSKTPSKHLKLNSIYSDHQIILSLCDTILNSLVVIEGGGITSLWDPALFTGFED